VAEKPPEALSTRALIEELTANATLLVRRQIKLAQLEVRGEARREKATAAWLAVAGAIAFAGAVALAMAGALAVGAALDGRYWLGALIVGGGLVLVAGGLLSVGWSKRVKTPLGRTRKELKREIAWARQQLT
jgi:hypothetical protein